MSSTTTRQHHGVSTAAPPEAGPRNGEPQGDWLEIDGEGYYRICDVDHMPVFLMSVVSASDHWLFLASNGGLTAGRKNADNALFPYETEDKVAAHRESTGSTTLFRLHGESGPTIWEPFAEGNARRHRVRRHLYKNTAGSAVILEEENIDLALRFRLQWRSGDRYGFVRTCRLENMCDAPKELEVLDGLQNLLPSDATLALQTEMSSLLDAYKRSELDLPSGVGIFSMSATLTDRAEPSESLLATVAWQVGLEAHTHLLSATQISSFLAGAELRGEEDICGAAGSYLVQSRLHLEAGQARHWHVVADVNQDSAGVADLCELVTQRGEELEDLLEADIAENMDGLVRYVAGTDGLQLSARRATSAHHFANVMFNIMRGGLLAEGYTVSRDDFTEFVRVRNRPVLQEYEGWFGALPEKLELAELYARARAEGSADLLRLCYEYLPLTFSRRHGDPSRPWNRFSINVKRPDGSPRLDYQGNWRDIFQNWEPLIATYPDMAPGVISKFLNATTIDGYNPYRITRDGLEWEIPEPENPWSNIGYWSDHQIIYLQKLLEIAEELTPGSFAELGGEAIFSTADVPYRIRRYSDMLEDWSNTIEFDREKHQAIEKAGARIGTDSRLHRDGEGKVAHVTMTEKLLVLLLAKLTNLVPDGGIWMNTQRPEWNDANNALVGKGLSVVTVAYLHRFVSFWRERIAEAGGDTVELTPAVAALLERALEVLERFSRHLNTGFDDRQRRSFMDEMGAAASSYRSRAYREGFPAERREVSRDQLRKLLDRTAAYTEQTLRHNRRSDGLYHSYNILLLRDDRALVGELYLMLEGQVAVLSAGLLSPEEALDLLRGLRAGPLYREDQHSYMLYPYRSLPGFRVKNTLPRDRAGSSALLSALVAAGDRRLVVQDAGGELHFAGQIHNARSLGSVLDELEQDPAYAKLVARDRGTVLDLYEEVFDHRAFTGRSGKFFAYEGLGSIYWHMVSKLLLAVQENYSWAREAGADAQTCRALADAYYDIRAGLGFNKSPAVYGAFPTDPYSHSPWRAGARQPGMTGQVKEEVLTRWGELGVEVRAGSLRFAPSLLCEEEFSPNSGSFSYLDLQGAWQELSTGPESLAFTYCQTPVVYRLGDAAGITVEFRDGTTASVTGDRLDGETSRAILGRTGRVKTLRVTVPRASCRSCTTADGGSNSTAERTTQ